MESGAGARDASPAHLGEDTRLYFRCDGKASEGVTDIGKCKLWHVSAARKARRDAGRLTVTLSR